MKFYLVCVLISIGVIGTIAQEQHDRKLIMIESSHSYSGRESAVTDYIYLYQKYISGARGSQCPMYPSCSNYGLMVFRERPFYEAIVLTSDRLLRCGNDQHFYHETYQNGTSRLLDYPSYKAIPTNLIYHPVQYVYADNLKAYTKEDSCKLFVNHLINNADYNLALLEIERNIYYNKNCDVDYYINKLSCYEALDREEDAIYDYQFRFPASVQNDEKVKIKMSGIYYKIDNYEYALNVLKGTQYDDVDNKYKSLVLQGIIAIRKKNYTEAESLFLEASQYDLAKTTSSKNLTILKEICNAKVKKSSAAKLLSVVPGGGYLYTHHYKNALTSFLINAALGYATYSCINNKNYGMAIITGIFSVSFYAGNILGAGNSAVRYNQYIIEKGVNKLNYK